jgi:serine/threonine-protein kinase
MNEAAPSLPEAFGPFVLAKLIHLGGMGELFLARSPIPGFPVVVVKRLRPDLIGMVPFERFRHEAELAVRLQHPNVVQSLSVGEVERRRYLALEPIIGQSLMSLSERLVEKKAGIPAELVTRVMIDVLSALAYLHAACDERGRPLDLLHRDITPGNVLIGYDGEVKIGDFGVASSHMTENLALTQPGTVVGTPAYVAPEFLRGDDMGPTVDIYGLGGVAYRLLTGKSPFEGQNRVVVMKVMGQAPPPARELRPDAPRWLTDIIDRMLAHDPSVRPQSAAELRDQLAMVAENAGCLASNPQLGRYLSNCFEPERSRDEATVRAIAHIDLASIVQVKKGSTVVLASSGSAPKLLPKLERKRDVRPVRAMPAPVSAELGWGSAAAAAALAVLLGILSASPEASRRWNRERDVSERLDAASALLADSQAIEARKALLLSLSADRAFAVGDVRRAETYVEDLERYLDR